MKKKIIIVFDFSDTLVKMRPPKLLVKRSLLLNLSQKANLGIITGAKKTETSNILFKLKVGTCFDFVVTKDDSPFQKPDKRLLEKVKKNFKSEKIIYLGDAKKDFIFAQNAKVDFCYVGKREYGIYQNKDINQIINFIVKKFLE